MAELGRLVRIHGQAPLGATVYELQKLRCNLCGTIFTAPAPPEVGGHTAWGGILRGAAHLWHIYAGAHNAINPSFSQL